MNAGIQFQTAYRTIHPFQRFSTNSWTEASKEPSLLILHSSGMETKAQKVKASVGVGSSPLAILAIHQPGLIRVEFKSTLSESSPQSHQQVFGFLLATTVTNHIVSIPLKRHTAMMALHPCIEGVMQVEVR